MDFSIESAIDYIQSKIADFYGKRAELHQTYQEARQAVQIAHQENRMIPEAEDFLNSTIQLLNDHAELEQRLKPLADAFNVDTGLGFLPAVQTAILLVGGTVAAIGLATALYGFYDSYATNRQRRELIAQGLLPASAALNPSIFEQIGQMLGNAGVLILLGVGAWLIYTNVNER